MNTVSTHYLEGIKEGRAYLTKYGAADIDAHIANLRSTMKGFPASTPVGQMLRGELDFWRNQKARGAR